MRFPPGLREGDAMLETDALLDRIMKETEADIIAHGAQGLTMARDETAGTPVRLGQQLFARITNRGAEDARVLAVRVAGLAEAGADRELLALRRAELRIALRDALRDHAGLAEELAELLPKGSAGRAGGDRSVFVGRDSSGVIYVGDGAHITLHR
ncbi:hypothetical protein [Streptomyces anulatus]|uniref:hypothetical protein n=1 Tax=Streptomyces anulatus TaxID=1892 RepID=UPI00386E7F8D|nr:hypothetical protein OG536_17730 [Streptomyces anulatus]